MVYSWNTPYRDMLLITPAPTGTVSSGINRNFSGIADVLYNITGLTGSFVLSSTLNNYSPTSSIQNNFLYLDQNSITQTGTGTLSFEKGNFLNNLTVSGNVGIKNPSPAYTLDVNGTGQFSGLISSNIDLISLNAYNNYPLNTIDFIGKADASTNNTFASIVGGKFNNIISDSGGYLSFNVFDGETGIYRILNTSTSQKINSYYGFREAARINESGKFLVKQIWTTGTFQGVSGQNANIIANNINNTFIAQKDDYLIALNIAPKFIDNQYDYPNRICFQIAPTTGLASEGQTLMYSHIYEKFLQPNGTTLYYNQFDGTNFHHYLNMSNQYNLAATKSLLINGDVGTVFGVIGGCSFTLNSPIDASSNTIAINNSAYATVAIPRTSVYAMKLSTWGWNGTNGSSNESRTYFKQTQLGTGLGTTALNKARFDIEDSNHRALMSFNLESGNIGINQINPLYTLDVNGSGRFTSGLIISGDLKVLNNGNTNVLISPDPAGAYSRTSNLVLGGMRDGTTQNLGMINFVNVGTAYRAAIYGNLGTALTHGNLGFYTAKSNSLTEKMRLTEDGYLGINTINPSYTLDVAGSGRIGTGVDGVAGATIFESDGTVVCTGSATTWEDVNWNVMQGRTEATNIPNFIPMVGNIYGNCFSVNNVIQLGVIEIPHSWKEGSTIEAHVHWATSGAAATNGPKNVAWSLEYSWANMDNTSISTGFPATTIISGNTVMPANTYPALTHVYTSLGTITLTNGKVGAGLVGRLRRLTATGTAPTGNPFALQVGLHYEQDTMGSRTTSSK